MLVVNYQGGFNMLKTGGGSIKAGLMAMLFAVVLSAFASDKVFENVENSKYTFHYERSNSVKSKTNNFFIREIARHNFNSLTNTTFTYYYSVHQSISKSEANKFLVKTKINGEKCTGDIYYRDFDISDILMPDHADINIAIYSGDTYLEDFCFKDLIKNKQGDFEIEFVFEGDEVADNYRAAVKNVDFYSVSNDKDIFFDRIHAIDTYYTGIAVAERLINELDGLDTKNSYMLPGMYVRLKEAERVYNVVKNFDFPQELNLSSYDRAGYYSKLKELGREIAHYNYRFENLLNSVDFINIDGSIESIAKDYVEMTSHYFDLSLEVTHWQSSIYYDLGLVKYSNEMLVNYFSGFEKIIEKTYVYNNKENVLNIFKNQIFRSYLEKAREFNEKESFYLATGVLKNAERFYYLVYGTAMPVEYNILNAKTNYGIYNSYIQVYDRAIKVGNFELAENYIKKAGEFQKQHSETIITDKYLNKMKINLINRYIKKGISLNESKDFYEAKYCFEQAYRLSASVSGFNMNIVIKQGLGKAIDGLYNSYIDKARFYFGKGDFFKANDEILKAQELYNSNSSGIMPSLHDNDIGIVPSQNIFNKNYRTQNSIINKFIKKANLLVNSSDFIGAVKILKKSFKVDNQNPYCEFNLVMVKSIINKYEPLAKYQQLAKEARKALLSKDYESFLEICKKMERISDENEIVRVKIEPIPLFYLFSVKNNLA